MKHIEVHQLPEEIQGDIKLAFEQIPRAFPKACTTKVGAVLTAADGQKFTGANIRRRATSNSTCAERMVFDKALNSGVSQLQRLVIIGVNELDPFVEIGISPCGSCRQIMIDALTELFQQDLEIVIVNESQTKALVTSVQELMPISYNHAQSVVKS
ncbi:MAG TPA: hypothetical protein VD999_01940 [Vitreimonas sp.]|nr:hypothetical protein [Vitreimonas sp.]